MPQLKVALSHDVDRVRKTHQYLTRSLRYFARRDLSGLKHELTSFEERRQVYWNFPDIMKTEACLGVRSTFFFLQESFPFQLFQFSSWKLALGRYDVREENVAAIIRQLDQEGWEIGLHGSYRSYQDPVLLKKEKEQLEQVLGHQVAGIRQHYLNLSDMTWQIQHEAGFNYDSSLGYTDRIGYKGDHVVPFRPFNEAFMVFPLSVMDSCFLEDSDRDANLIRVMNQTIEADGVLVLNWHSNSWNAREFPGYKDVYVKIVRQLLEAGAVFKTLDEFYQEYNVDSIVQ